MRTLTLLWEEVVIPVAWVSTTVVAVVAVGGARGTLEATGAAAAVQVATAEEAPAASKIHMISSPPEQTMPTPHGVSIKRLGIVLVILVLLFLAAAAVQLRFNNEPSQQSHAEFYNALVTENTSFVEAEQLVGAGRFAEAIPFYIQSLDATSDSEQRLQIQLLLARTLIAVQSYTEAVPLLKEIIASDADVRTVRARALAVTEIAKVYTQGNKEVNRDIFRTEPFKSLWVKGDVDLTLRHLYEYAASVHPIAIAQLNIAQWYASRLPAAESMLEARDQDISNYAETIHELIVSADQDIQYLQTQTMMTGDLREAMLARARVTVDLNRAGDFSHGDMDAWFKETISAYASDRAGGDGVARYYYAIAIAQLYGEKRKTDIQIVLAPLSTPAYESSVVVNTLKFARTSSFYRQFPILLASFDPVFKAHLITLGWTEADFAR